MNLPDLDRAAQLRWAIYGILIALAVGNMTGRILAVNSVDKMRLESQRIKQRLQEFRKKQEDKGLSGDELEEKVAQRQAKYEKDLRLQRPFLSSNDRSRWLTVRSLVELGTYRIEKLLEEPTWDTIDMVGYEDDSGELHLYSSKPPLLATIVAGEYWLLHKATGWTLGDHPYELGRIMLITINVIPFAIMLLLIACTVESIVSSDYAKVFVVAGASLATLLTAFAVVLNNHLPAAVSVTFTLYALVRIWHQQDRGISWYLLAGFFAAFTVTCELPALSLFAVVGAALLWSNARNTLLGFVPAALVVAGGFFGTNYIAHESLRPPYAHRSETDPSDNWYVFEYTINGKTRESYWSNPKGIDSGEPSKATYALHVLVGHHGIFSLTPIWLFSVLGCAIWMVRGRTNNPASDALASIVRQQIDRDDPSAVAPATVDDNDQPPISTERLLALSTALLTVVCLVFYILLRPQQDRNYGGMTGGFRWMFWFAPLWLVVALPALDWLAKNRVGRLLAGALLALSVVSVAYLTWNPFRQPWLAVFMEYMGWVKF